MSDSSQLGFCVRIVSETGTIRTQKPEAYGARLAAAFLTGAAFFAGDFLAGAAFFATDVLATDFLAGDFFGAAAGAGCAADSGAGRLRGTGFT